MQPLDRVRPVARRLLTLQVTEEREDTWLWERADRVHRLAQLLAKIPALSDQAPDLEALGVAGLFHCAGWVTQVQQGRIDRSQVLSRPTSEIQRELGAAALLEHAAPLLPAKTGRLAADAVRQAGNRRTALLEARVLADAESLDDLGVIYILRQFRSYQGDGRSLRQLVESWRRQEEYHYWEVRINDGFHFESVRQLAFERLKAVAAFIEALDRDLGALDVQRFLGMEPTRSISDSTHTRRE